MVAYVVAVLCVVGIATGQILFKLSAITLSETGSFLSIRTIMAFAPPMILYAGTSVAWVWVLQHADLGRVYPLMALAFVLVPLGSHLAFGERFQLQYFLGVALIMTGIIIAAKA